ncbi:hypothetical protein DH2020_010337 [Rehmannia glutinosa]|uniref:mannosyl-glycoprotein endo-beta-N-acetylglucosaminidase n=1 Tax=Rehmannia glutinosa TaxID=99300 RepID=A0ABR0XAD5_REHGL
METTVDGSSTAAGADPLPPFDPSVPAVPISYPLQTLEELESRAYFKSFHYPFNQAAVKLPTAGGGRCAELPQRPRILVCHDMAGGYTDDRFVQGGKNADAYAIWHWYLIDVFVYFSHSLVTLPPPCWINTAHRHGVKVLGTFIMEWDEGKKRADKLLSTKDSAQMYAERLTELAVALGFDGWLINMEVTLDPGQIPNLKAFVSHLSQTMHSSLPGSLVIWYDSVTVDGDLSWQDQLNDKNKPFFDSCDGIFVNYTWKEDFPKLSADVAGDRKFDVYMGIDVFGRGTYGGGQWTTDVALDVIKKNEVSAAIFAPGWVYETKQPPDFQTAQNRVMVTTYTVMESKFLTLLGTTFLPKAFSFKEASYNGGGNITFTGALGDSAEFTARLFQGELLLGKSQVHFTYSVKSSGNSQLCLALEFSSATEDKKNSVFLAASGNTLLTMNQFSSRFTSVIMPRRVTKLDEKTGWVIQESSIDMAGQILKEIRAICYRSKPGKSVAVAADTTLSDGPSDYYYAVLGDIKITTDGENSKFPPSNLWLVGREFVTSSSSGNQSRNEYIGVALVKSFYISDLEVPEGTSSLKFIIQVCGLDGTCQKLEDSPFFQLQVESS